MLYIIDTLAHGGGAFLVLFNLAGLCRSCLLALEARALPAQWRMRSIYKHVVWSLSSIVMLSGSTWP